MGWKDKPKPPIPPKPPTPEVHQVGVSVRNQNGEGLGNAIGTLIPDTYDVSILMDSNTNGRIIFTIPNSIPYPDWGYNLFVKCQGYKDLQTRVIPAQSTSYDVTLEISIIELTRLVPSGQFLRKVNGEHFTCIEASGFTLYQKFLDGIDISPVIGQLADIGFNLVRIFGMYNNPVINQGIGRFIPFEYSSYFARLSDFFSLLASYRMYGEFTAFADVTQIYPNMDQQVNHWTRVCDSLRPITNCLLEVVNENDQSINNLASIQQLARPNGIITSHGSNGSQAPPVSPYWDYATFHTNGASEEQRKVGHNAMEVWQGPTLTNETSRNTLPYPFDSAAGAALLCAGSCYHTTSGKYGNVLNSDEAGRAREFVAGAMSINLACQDGSYSRTDPPDPYLRIYNRGSCTVKIRK